MVKTLITCDCSGSQQINTEALATATGLAVPAACSALCTRQLDRAQAALTEGDVMIACQQESRLFESLADEMGLPAPTFVDIRDRAGWTEDTTPPTAKMAALVQDALTPTRGAKTVDVISEGLCLILGAPEAALAAADQLADHLGVTVLLESGAEIPEDRRFDVVVGRLRQAKGALGGFTVTIDALQQVDPTGRGALRLTDPRDGALSDCDVILDLRGDTPLFPAHEKREGYLRADPGHPPAVAAAVLAASHLVGTFEKPLYVRAEPVLCAHSRASQQGCSRCLNLCPTGAILPEGDHVRIDPMVCAGCGACSSVCPSGAISYDAPPVDETLRRVQGLAKAYLAAGGSAPRLLVHDAHGAEMIRLSARHGRGLPADVVPMEMTALGAFGHAEALAALAAGFGHVTWLPGPAVDRDALAAQVALTAAISGEAAITLGDWSDPDAMSDALFAGAAPAPRATPIHPLGTRRQVTRQAARALAPETDQIALPLGAPYGAVVVDSDACTLCLSCVSLCPSGALGDNPDLPQLRFQEDACLQCGLCANLCPEKAITLEPRLDLTPAALEQRVVHEEEPFACIECGELFGVASTVNRITEKLKSHAMFDGDRLKLIQMCDDCRIQAQYHAADNPFQSAPRPRVRTTDDELKKRH